MWSGIWADFANAPTRISRQIATIAHSFWREDVGRAREHALEVERARVALDQDRRQHEADVADHVDHERLHARRAVAVRRRYQKLISAYEAKPTNAQPTIRITKLPASTSSNIEKTKKLR